MYPEETGLYYAILIGSLLLVSFIIIFLVSVLHYQKKKYALHKTNVRLEMNALEKERSRIASDLHDDLGASLSAIKLKLQCLSLTDEKENQLVYDSENYIDEAMLKLKRISFNMMPRVLEKKGLQHALQELIDLIEQTMLVRITFAYRCPLLSGEETIHVYRMVQEILNNIVKHSKATIAKVELNMVKNRLLLQITDNGIGFDKAAIMKSAPGQGLQNILARADILGAKMFLTTNPGKGAQYLFQIPFNI